MKRFKILCLLLILAMITAGLNACKCWNGGESVDFGQGCQCKCPTGYIGNQCQLNANPCEMPDDFYCLNVDCFNATSDDFFRCQSKCLCCQNMQCKTIALIKVKYINSSSRITPTCSCNCVSPSGSVSLFDPATNCGTLLPGVACLDDLRCRGQFNVGPAMKANCAYAFVRTMCPLSCGLCTIT